MKTNPDFSSSPSTSSANNSQGGGKTNAWKYSESKDDFDGRESKYCSITANNSIKGVVSSEKPRILVRQRGKKEINILVIANGVVFGHLGDSDRVRLKFDDEAPFSVGYDEAADGSSDTIFLRSTSKILPKLKTAKKLTLELPVFMETGERASFDIEGYSEVCKF